MSTLVASFFLSARLAQYKWMVCQRKDLTIFKWLDCKPDNTFTAMPVAETFAPLPSFIRDAVLRVLPADFALMPLQLHALSFAVRQRLQMLHAQATTHTPVRSSSRATLLALPATLLQMFAAVIAPFGGFFASGFKRALRVKDFGDSIPGHGGLTDRMDCQVVMAMFSCVYIDAIVGLGDVTVPGLVEKAQRLSGAEQLELYRILAQMLGLPPQ